MEEGWRYHIHSIKVKVKVTLVQALGLCTGRTAHRGSRGIALLFHDHGTRRGEGSASRPGRSLPSGKIRYPLYRRLGGPQGRLDRCGKSRPTGIRSPDRPTRSQSLYPLRYLTPASTLCIHVMNFGQTTHEKKRRVSDTNRNLGLSELKWHIFFPPTLVNRPVLHERHYSQGREEKDLGRPDDPFTEPVTQSFDLYTTDAPVVRLGIEYAKRKARTWKWTRNLILFCDTMISGR